VIRSLEGVSVGDDVQVLVSDGAFRSKVEEMKGTP